LVTYSGEYRISIVSKESNAFAKIFAVIGKLRIFSTMIFYLKAKEKWMLISEQISFQLILCCLNQHETNNLAVPRYQVIMGICPNLAVEAHTY